MCNLNYVLFEYDPAKSLSNADKHGIDFNTVQRMWDGVVIAAPARSIAEDRLMAIGLIDEKFWTVIATSRGAVLRIISARRSRQNEIKLYQDHSSQP